MNVGEPNAQQDHHNDLSAGERESGTNPGEEPTGSKLVSSPGGQSYDSHSGGDAGSAEQESSRIKLQPTYHAQLQEALIQEKDIEKVKVLSELLEKEAQREFLILTGQNESYERIQTHTISSANEQRKEELAQAKIDSDAATGNLVIASIVNFLKWCFPASFAILLAYWMVSFYRQNAVDAARSVREILLLMIGGALGWIAQAKSDLGAIARNDSQPPNSN